MSKMDIDSGFFGQAHRLHIDKIRARLEQLNCKTPGEQEVRLYKNEETKLAIIEIRSGAKNALSGRMISKLTEVIDQLYDWPQGRGVLICGYASTFCSGSDLIGVRETASLQWGLDLAAVMQYNMRRLQLLPMISVALVEGYALGGGAELACAADMRLFTDSAKIGFVHIKVAVCCGWGGGSRLVQLIGPSRALEVLSSGRLVGAPEALQLSLSNAIIKKDDENQCYSIITQDHRQPHSKVNKINNNVSQTIDDVALIFTRCCDVNGNQTGSSDDGRFELSAERREALKFLSQHTIGHLDTMKALKSMINSARFEPLQKALDKERHLYASSWGTEAHMAALASNLKHNC